MKKKLIKVMTLLIAGCISLTSIGVVPAYADSASETVETAEDNNFYGEVFPSQEFLNKEFGYLPKLVEEFKNGYKFDYYSICENYVEYENGEEEFVGNTVDFYYKKGDKSIAIYTEKMDNDEVKLSDSFKTELEKNGGKVINCNGATIIEVISTCKIVPKECKETEDKKEVIKKSVICSVYKDGIEYTINSQDLEEGLSEQDAIDIAKEIAEL